MNHKLLIIIAFIPLFLSNTFLIAQNSTIYGKVFDKNNGKPIEDVNVYLANTQIGTTTNKNGYFEFRKLPQGTFTVVLSHVAYYFIKKEVKLVRKFNDLGVIGFSQKAHELETVLVSDDEDDTWEDQFEIFRDNFIGESKNSDSTFIVNPYKIDFYEKNGKLLASSTDPIEIINRSLGYKIKYFLDYFEATIDYTKYSGNAVFIPLSSKSLSDSIRWETNRIETFTGSFRHFLEVLNNGYSTFMVNSVLNSNGFFIYSVRDLPWRVPRPFAELPISTRKLLSDGNIETERYLSFQHFLRIYYIPDYDDNEYLVNYYIKYINNSQASYLELEKDSVMIDIRGRYYDKFGIHTFGNFGQERISDMLPYEYTYVEMKDEN